MCKWPFCSHAKCIGRRVDRSSHRDLGLLSTCHRSEVPMDYFLARVNKYFQIKIQVPFYQKMSRLDGSTDLRWEREEFTTCFIIRKFPSASLKWPHLCSYNVKAVGQFIPASEKVSKTRISLCVWHSCLLVGWFSVHFFTSVLAKMCWSY